MAIDIQDIINKKTNHLLELLKQKKDVVKEEEYDKDKNDTPIIIEEKTPIADIVLQKIEKILDLLREKKNKNDNVKTLVETSLSVLLSVLNNQGKQSATFPELASAIMNNGGIVKPIENIEESIPSKKIPVYVGLAAEFLSSILRIVEDNIARDEIKKAIELVEALKFQEITTSNVEQLVDISTKILEEISNTVSQIPGAPVVQPLGAPLVQPGVQAPASTYYNSMIHKNSDIGTFLAAAIGNALVDKKPNRIDNILSKLMKTGTIFKSVFKGIDMKAMSQRLSSLSLQSGTTPNVNFSSPFGTTPNVNPSSPFGSMQIPTISLDATIDIFKLTIGFPFAFIKYCSEQGIKIPQTIIDTFKQKVATTLDPNSVTNTTQDKNNTTNMDAETNKSAIDTQQKEVKCSDPNVIKLGQVEDTALCFDPKQNKVIATK